VSRSLTNTPVDDVYDKKVLVKKSSGWQPDPAGGQGSGTQRYSTETSTTTKMRETIRK
jgi:hypothetical protein